MSDHERLLHGFFKRWSVSFDVLCASMLDTMDERCVFKQTQFPDLHGPQQTVAFMKIENGKIVAWRDYFDSAEMPAGAR